MTTVEEAVASIAEAPSWDARIAAMRLIPEQFGTASHQEVYSAIARAVYVPSLAPDFAYVHWHQDYELPLAQQTYEQAYELTDGFSRVGVDDLVRAMTEAPATLRVFRLILGFTAQEFAAATALVVDAVARPLTTARIRGIESGSPAKPKILQQCAAVIDQTMRKTLFGSSPSSEIRLKTDKPDTIDGWASVQKYAAGGVPLALFLHQRQYGGAFRQLLDATSSKRGDVIEDAVQELLENLQIPFVRTGSHNQEEIATRFGLTVKPAPDFVMFDAKGVLRAILECKGANDGGTARDKAARFRSLREETKRLGGIPLFAVLAGLGWTRTADALGPVIRDTDGRTFTIPTLPQMATVQPLPTLAQTQF